MTEPSLNEGEEKADISVERLPGRSPDELVHVGRRRMEDVQLEWISYNVSHCKRREISDVREALQLLLEDVPEDGTRWLRVTGLHDVEVISQIADALGIHPLVRQDILNTEHRPKVEQYDDFLFVTLKSVGEPQIAFSDVLETEQVSLVVMSKLLVTFHESPSPLLDPVLERLQGGNQRIRQLGSEYLAWAVMDVAVDHFFPVIDWLEDRMDVLEERLFDGNDKVEAHEIFMCRRQATALSHVVRPLRDLTVRLQRIDSPFLTKTTEPFFRDLADHGGHLAAATDSLRDSSISLRDFHSTALSNQLNEVMRFLASFSALFLPLTFLAGVYGMNFDAMPELEQPWAYPALWLIFLLTGVGMFLLFRKKRWI